MAQYQDLFGFDRFAQAQDMARQWERQDQQDRMTLANMQETQRHNALVEKYALEDRQRKTDIRNAMSQPVQTGGPLSGMQDYQPVGSRQPTRQEYGERLMGLGEYEQGLKFMPDEVKPGKVNYSPYGYGQMIDDNGNVVKVPTPPASANGNGSSTPYFTPVQTANGVISFDARTGKGRPLDVNGNPVIGAAADPSLQGEIARAKESGKVSGGATTQAKIDLPQNVQEAEDTIGLIDSMLTHPGMKQAVGKSSLLGLQKVPGTEAKSFMVALEQLKGKQFLQAFQSLKGGGQITEIEGQKATQAMSRMDNANTEKEFVAASREFQGIIRKGVERAKQKAGVQANIAKLSDADLLKALGVK